MEERGDGADVAVTGWGCTGERGARMQGRFLLALGVCELQAASAEGRGDGGTREREQRERDGAEEVVEAKPVHWAMATVPILLSLSVGSKGGKQGTQVCLL